MNFLVMLLQILLTVVCILTAATSILFFIRLRWPAPVWWILKLYASSLSYFIVFTGIICMIAGWTMHSTFLFTIASYIVLVYAAHFLLVTAAPKQSGSFENAFGIQYESRIKPDQKKFFLSSRRIFSLPEVSEPGFIKDLPFATIAESSRTIYADLWHPAETTKPSKLAFIFLHGSAFYFLDKDMGTRPLFRHLTAQGHLIMDVAYRLAPETDIMGMVHDVKRAIHWIKSNSAEYQINPDRIVVGGGSAGGTLALMAAYTAKDDRFTPPELTGKDLSCEGVISLYGPTDLAAHYYHTRQHLTTREVPGQPKKKVPTQMPEWIKKKMGSDYHRLGLDKGFEKAGALAPLLGGHPDECADTYAFYSPLTHVHAKCPPTLLIHGGHDLMAPVRTTRLLKERLSGKNIPVVMHILPQTDHAFDMALPKLSPATHSAIYDMERFLAMMV